MIHETIYTKTIAKNPGPELEVPPEFYPLFRSKILRHGNNHIRFSCTSVRMTNLIGKFSKRFKKLGVKWSVDYSDTETYDDPVHQFASQTR